MTRFLVSLPILALLATGPARADDVTDALQNAIDAYPGTTVAYVFGVESRGSYSRDHRGVHHIAPAAAVLCSPARDAFGWLFDRKTGLKIADEDWATLDGLNAFIADNKLGAPVVYDYR